MLIKSEEFALAVRYKDDLPKSSIFVQRSPLQRCLIIHVYGDPFLVNWNFTIGFAVPQ